jgi:hypothetical protein
MAKYELKEEKYMERFQWFLLIAVCILAAINAINEWWLFFICNVITAVILVFGLMMVRSWRIPEDESDRQMSRSKDDKVKELIKLLKDVR